MILPNIKKITMKRLDQLKRNSGGKDYTNWRDGVLKRDGHKCQYPFCNETTKLQVHHIRRFADARHLKTNTLNGISLCTSHHRMINGNEGAYELQFFRIALANDAKYKKDQETNKDNS